MGLQVFATSYSSAIAVVVTAFAFLYTFYLKTKPQQIVVEELALYNGTDEGLPIILRNSWTCARITVVLFGYNLEMLPVHLFRETLQEMDSQTHYMAYPAPRLRASLNGGISILGATHELFVGKLVGRYYDSRGNPTKSLKGVEAKAARGAQLLEKQKNEEAKQPSCNSRWSQNEGGEVWCDVGYPRLVQRPIEMALSGKMSKRCACFKEDELDQPGLEVYEGCDYLAKTCPAQKKFDTLV